MSNEKKSFWYGFQISDRESCEAAIRNGGIAALISAGITAVFGIVGFFMQSSDAELKQLLDPWILLDVVLIVVLAFFIFRKSRVASTLLVVHFTVSKLIMWTEAGKASGVLLTIIFLLYYITAMRGTYIWYSKYRDTPAAAAA